ncbi:hypothetical protein [Streptomyces sp. DSM 40907]|uniref:hypothetical protein n=1 Tax=Streptomyces kutzneri TaxID=3051179 RepID=UPI0028D70B5C|nr:hypothetical protein [Streptomyces sp. DSM 40907]
MRAEKGIASGGDAFNVNGHHIKVHVGRPSKRSIASIVLVVLLPLSGIGWMLSAEDERQPSAASASPSASPYASPSGISRIPEADTAGELSPSLPGPSSMSSPPGVPKPKFGAADAPVTPLCREVGESGVQLTPSDELRVSGVGSLRARVKCTTGPGEHLRYMVEIENIMDPPKPAKRGFYLKGEIYAGVADQRIEINFTKKDDPARDVVRYGFVQLLRDGEIVALEKEAAQQADKATLAGLPGGSKTVSGKVRVISY